MKKHILLIIIIFNCIIVIAQTNLNVMPSVIAGSKECDKIKLEGKLNNYIVIKNPETQAYLNKLNNQIGALSTTTASGNCAGALPFCADNLSGTTFPATTGSGNAAAGPYYDCLSTTPNPAWYYFQVSQSGNISIGISGTGGNDVDFICWGPFATATGNCSNSSLSSGNVIDCSYSSSATETCTIPNAISGQYYMLLLTNFSNQNQNINFNQVGSNSSGAGSTNCNLVATVNSSTICPAGSATVIANTTLQTPTYSWSPGGQITSSIVVTPVSTTVYTVTITGLNALNIQTVTVHSGTVSVAGNPTVSIPSTLGLCSGASSVLVTSTITPSGNYSYNWSNGSTSQAASVNTATTITVQVTNNLTGCVSLASNTCTIVVAANPTVALSPTPIVFCNGFNTTLTPTVTGGLSTYNYSWTPNAGSAATATVNLPGTYSVLVTDANSCKGTATVSVLRSSPTVTITSPDLILCPGDCATLTAIGTSSFAPFTYSWSGIPNTNSVNIICGPATSSVSFTDAKGCIATKTIATINDIIPVASFTASPTTSITPGLVITYTNTSTISSGSIISNYWNFGDGTNASTVNTTNSYSGAGNFTVTLIVTGSSGCKDTATMVFIVDAIINIPNVITPNGDGVNDFLKFNNLDVFSGNNIIIFNRWGNKVFEVDNYKNDWSGGGHTDGTYYFILTVPKAKPTIYNGYFQMIR